MQLPYDVGKHYNITVCRDVIIPLVDGPEERDISLTTGQQFTGHFVSMTRGSELRVFSIDGLGGKLYFNKSEISAFPVK